MVFFAVGAGEVCAAESLQVLLSYSSSGSVDGQVKSTTEIAVAQTPGCKGHSSPAIEVR